MATAAEQREIIALVVGMVNAAPGADILAELEDIIDSGLTIEELAIAISENPAFSGDTGIFPDFLPNAIFAEEFLTALLGDEVTEAVLDASVVEMTASLNAGESRGAAMNAAINALVASTDPDFADAATALQNKTDVASYYSIDVAQSSADLADLIAVLDGVDSDEDAVEDGTDAVDDTVAGAQPLVTLINDLDDANDAVAAFLKATDIDGNPLTATTEAAVKAQPAAEATAMDGAALTTDPLTGESVGTQNAFIADQVLANTLAIATPLTGTAALLTASKAVIGGTGSITGLDAAIAANGMAALTTFGATAAETISDTVMETAVTTFNVNPLVADIGFFNGGVAITAPAGTAITSVGSAGAADLITTISKVLTITPGVTEATNPGVTALLAAVVARNAVTKAQDAAVAAQATALDLVENLDPTGPHVTASDVVEALFSVSALFDTPAKILAATPTLVEFGIESDALKALVDTGALAVLSAALDATTTVVGVTGATTAAVAAGTISAADKVAIDLTADAIANGTESAALAANSPAVRSTAFDAALGLYEAVVGFGAITTTFNGADAANTAAEKVVTTLATAVAKLDASNADVAALKVLTDAVAAAKTAFGDADFAVPVELSATVAIATAADDVFLTVESDSNIINFGVATSTDGEDQLFIGDGLTLNTDAVAGDNGDNAVLEVWITASGGNTVITVETSVFGSDAADPETFAITLTGVAVADVNLDGGIITV